jgi:hypothetical protein
LPGKGVFLARISKNKVIDLLLKGILLALLAWVIYRQVFADSTWAQVRAAFEDPTDQRNWWYLVVVIVLIPVNWSLETLKWLSLLPRQVGITFWSSLRAVLAGVAVSIITPNRIGEYGGRILLVEGRQRWNAVLATLVGSIAQMLVLLSGGMVGLAIYGKDRLAFTDLQYRSILIGLFVLLSLGFYIFFNIHRFAGAIRRISKRFKLFKHLLRIGAYRSRVLLRGLKWAALRYCTYVLQYLLILYFFGIEPPYLVGLAGIATIYLIQTSVPLPPLVAIFARGEIALLIWGAYSNVEVSILAASMSLFILNLVVPALLGAVILVQINVLKSLGYETSE